MPEARATVSNIVIRAQLKIIQSQTICLFNNSLIHTVGHNFKNVDFKMFYFIYLGIYWAILSGTFCAVSTLFKKSSISHSSTMSPLFFQRQGFIYIAYSQPLLSIVLFFWFFFHFYNDIFDEPAEATIAEVLRNLFDHLFQPMQPIPSLLAHCWPLNGTALI